MAHLPQYLADTWYFYRKHFISLCVILLPLTLPIDIIYTALEFNPEGVISDDAPILLWLFSMLLYPLYQGAVILFLAAKVNSKNASIRDCYIRAWHYYRPLLMVYFLSSLAMVAGFMLFIIPGFFIAARLMFAEFYCIFEDKKSLEAISLSGEICRAYQSLFLAALLIYIIIIAGPLIAVEYLLQQQLIWSWPLSLMVNVVSTLTTPLMTIFAFRVYSHHTGMDKTATQSQEII